MMKGLNFQYKIFRKQDLSNWFLVGVDLRGTILEEANLARADLGFFLGKVPIDANRIALVCPHKTKQSEQSS